MQDIEVIKAEQDEAATDRTRAISLTAIQDTVADELKVFRR